MAMPKAEGVVSRLYVNTPRNHEHRLEPNAFFANISLRPQLGALADITNRDKVILCEAIFIALDHDAARVELERNERSFVSKAGV